MQIKIWNCKNVKYVPQKDEIWSPEYKFFRVGSYAKLKRTQSTQDCPYKFRGSPNHHHLKNHWRDSQKSLKAAILMIRVYYT